MCGGVAFKLSKIPKKELEKYYSEKEINDFSEKEEWQGFFWSKEPLLPVEEGSDIKLIPWGNRDKEVDLPQTGWAKEESVTEGKWAYLKPNDVKIVADRGYEKGVWFPINGSLKGIKVDKHVYMLTKEADKEYLKLTKHNRQPIIIK